MGTDRSAASNKWNPGYTNADEASAYYVIYSPAGQQLPPLSIMQIMRQPGFCNIGRTAIVLQQVEQRFAGMCGN